MDLSLEDRVVLVSGGARGIGAAVARTFATEGANISILDMADDEACQASVSACRGLGAKAISVVADVADRESTDGAVAHTVNTFGRIDILVHSAGIVRRADALDDNDAGWDRVMNVHLLGARNLCRAVVPGMKSRFYGKIVVLGSLAAHIEGGD
jgi:NAD(P)-dependent dehydrogenase (short-subunit alcohol dehydrogenase family)